MNHLCTPYKPAYLALSFCFACVDQAATIEFNLYYENTTNLHYLHIMRQKERELDELFQMVISVFVQLLFCIHFTCVIKFVVDQIAG